MKPPRAFTLVELLVTIAIIALLIALLLPTLSRARDQAKLTKCLANLHAIAVGMSTYNSQNDDMMPQSAEFSLGQFPSNNHNPPQGFLGLSWEEALYADGDFLQNTNFNGLIDNNGTWSNFCSGISVFQCPSHSIDTQYGTSSTPDDSRIDQGYGMAWCAVSDFNFPTEYGVYPFPVQTIVPNFIVRAKLLNPGHIMITEGNEEMGSYGGYSTIPTPPAVSGYRPFLRHRQNQSWGANYLFADSHAEWSNQYHLFPSPLNFTKTVATANKTLSKIWVHGVGDN